MAVRPVRLLQSVAGRGAHGAEMKRWRMFLEGEVDWVLMLGLLAGVMTVVALVSLWFAVTHRVRHVSASDELGVVQKVAVSADKRLFETMNAIPVAIVETDMQGKFVFANRAAHQLLGRRDAELIGLRFHSATWGITYPDGRTIPPDLLPSARALRGQTVRGFQHLMANPSTRRKMLVSVTAMPIENEYGQVIGSTAAIVETEGLTTPEAPAPEPVAETARDDISRRVFEVATSALIVVSTHGQVLQANRMALEHLGRENAILGADFADLVLVGEDRVAAREALREALTAGAAEPIESAGMAWRILPLADADGAVDALLLAGDPVALEDVPAAPELALDLADSPPAEPDALETLRRQRDQALSDAAAAQAEGEAGRRFESVGRMTGGVAQDFHALLTVMTSALDMMLKQADDPGRVRRLGQAALAAGQRGEAMTQRLLAFTHADADQPVEALDAGVLLRAMEPQLRHLAGPGVDLLIEGPSVAAPVRLDPVAFEAAVKALVANAVAAVGQTGSVAVRLEAIDDGARLTVRDSGAGMDGDTLARAREPFFTTRKGSAGLGLAQVQAFTRQSGGVLSIDSAPGQGSEIALTLPSCSTGTRAA